ncbi:MAG: DinB family protein [Acidobacteria bacterium]|nr:DinB family protein [Acidobacteriota bacterium]
MPPPTSEREYFLTLLDEAYEKQAWHGPNLRGSLRGVGAAAAAWRPTPARHNIWELAVHAAYWKYAVRRRLTGEKKRSFPLEGSNFFLRPQAETEEAWKEDLALLAVQHRLLRDTVLKLPPAGFTPKSARMIRGAAMHDIYHAGQISLLKRMAPHG